jgi:K+-transporting ATPase KdpF subunit
LHELGAGAPVLPSGKAVKMIWLYCSITVLASALLIYLVIALLWPERFS